MCGPLLSHSRYMPRPPHPPRLDNSDYTWRRIQVMKLLIMQFSTNPYHHLSPIHSKYSPQHAVLNHLQFMFLP
jgi:hypothetical protein